MRVSLCLAVRPSQYPIDLVLKFGNCTAGGHTRVALAWLTFLFGTKRRQQGKYAKVNNTNTHASERNHMQVNLR